MCYPRFIYYIYMWNCKMIINYVENLYLSAVIIYSNPIIYVTIHVISICWPDTRRNTFYVFFDKNSKDWFNVKCPRTRETIIFNILLSKMPRFSFSRFSFVSPTVRDAFRRSLRHRPPPPRSFSVCSICNIFFKRVRLFQRLSDICR